jgi:hypothetical protein
MKVMISYKFKQIFLWALPILLGVSILFLAPGFIRKAPMWFVNTYNETFSIKHEVNDSVNIKTTIDNSMNPTMTGVIGDTYGGTLGPTIAIVAAFLTFLAFWIQYIANIQQEKYIKQQRFEDSFFRLLDFHKKIVDSLDIRLKDDKSKVVASGNESFKNMYKEMKIKLENQTDIDLVNSAFDFVQDEYKHDLHHYFRFLYHILKFIKNSDTSESEKLKYSSILRASLSAYELVFLFYNCLHRFGNTHFKPLVEEFSFLKNLDQSLLFNRNQLGDSYHPLATSSSKDRNKHVKDWKKKNKKNCA